MCTNTNVYKYTYVWRAATRIWDLGTPWTNRRLFSTDTKIHSNTTYTTRFTPLSQNLVGRMACKVNLLDFLDRVFCVECFTVDGTKSTRLGVQFQVATLSDGTCFPCSCHDIFLDCRKPPTPCHVRCTCPGSSSFCSRLPWFVQAWEPIM